MTFCLPDGPEQEVRDEKWKESMARVLAQFEADDRMGGKMEFVSPKKDMNGKFPQPGVIAWIYAYDAKEEAGRALAEQS